MHYLRSFCFFLICLGFCTTTGYADITPDSSDTVSQQAPSPSLSRQLNEISLWAGYAFDSYRFWGTTPDARIQSYGLQYNRKLFKWKGAQVEYNLRINAYSKFSYPEFKVGRPRNTLYGFGLTPLGFQINFLSTKRIQPFLNSSGGMMILDEPFPDWRGEKFNFTFNMGAGLELMLSHSLSLSVGMRYHHVSNGDLGQVNPGIDSTVFYTAITLF